MGYSTTLKKIEKPLVLSLKKTDYALQLLL